MLFQPRVTTHRRTRAAIQKRLGLDSLELRLLLSASPSDLWDGQTEGAPSAIVAALVDSIDTTSRRDELLASFDDPALQEGDHIPVARNDVATTLRDHPINVDVLANDVDEDGDPLAIRITATMEGQAVVNDGGTPDDPLDDSVDFIPTPGFIGVGGFRYVVSDGESDSNEAEVTIGVLAPPPPRAVDDVSATREDAMVNVDVLANDVDAASDQLAINITGSVGGSAVVNDAGTPTDFADDTVDFTPAAGFVGAASFTYFLNDGELESNQATVSIEVSVNAAPTANADSAFAFPGAAVNVPVLANDQDPNGDALTIEIIASENGVATVNDAGTPDVPGDDSLNFQPDAGFLGTAVVQYRVTDGQLASDETSVTIVVSPVRASNGLFQIGGSTTDSWSFELRRLDPISPEDATTLVAYQVDDQSGASRGVPPADAQYEQQSLALGRNRWLFASREQAAYVRKGNSVFTFGLVKDMALMDWFRASVSGAATDAALGFLTPVDSHEVGRLEQIDALTWRLEWDKAGGGVYSYEIQVVPQENTVGQTPASSSAATGERAENDG